MHVRIGHFLDDNQPRISAPLEFRIYCMQSTKHKHGIRRSSLPLLHDKEGKQRSNACVLAQLAREARIINTKDLSMDAASIFTVLLF